MYRQVGWIMLFSKKNWLDFSVCICICMGIICFINEGCVFVLLQIKIYEGYFEIVLLVGILLSGGYLYMSISDVEGNVFGGYVFGDVIVYIIVEVIVGNCFGVVMNREEDKRIGYKELIV